MHGGIAKKVHRCLGSASIRPGTVVLHWSPGDGRGRADIEIENRTDAKLIAALLIEAGLLRPGWFLELIEAEIESAGSLECYRRLIVEDRDLLERIRLAGFGFSDEKISEMLRGAGDALRACALTKVVPPLGI